MFVCKLVEEVEPFLRMDLQSENSDSDSDFNFIIEDPEEKVEPVDDGLLPINCTA
jgi:hypothetical protein